MGRVLASMSETALQAHIVCLLESYGRHDIEWHAVPNGEKRNKKTAWLLKLTGVRAGVADLMFLIDGKPIALELKTEVGKQSSAQSEWQERFERAGGQYFIAFGIDQTIGVLNSIGAFRHRIVNSNPSED